MIREPAFAVAGYALLLLAGLTVYGGQRRSTQLAALPQWRAPAARPSCLDLVTALRGQLAARADLLADRGGSFALAHAVEQAAA